MTNQHCSPHFQKIKMHRKFYTTTTTKNQTTNSIDDELTIDIEQPCVTLWRENDIETWFVGYCIEVNDNVVTVEHIHRTEKCSNLKGKYPTKSGIAPVDNDQILDCEV